MKQAKCVTETLVAQRAVGFHMASDVRFQKDGTHTLWYLFSAAVGTTSAASVGSPLTCVCFKLAQKILPGNGRTGRNQVSE